MHSSTAFVIALSSAALGLSVAQLYACIVSPQMQDGNLQLSQHMGGDAWLGHSTPQDVCELSKISGCILPAADCSNPWAAVGQ